MTSLGYLARAAAAYLSADHLGRVALRPARSRGRHHRLVRDSDRLHDRRPRPVRVVLGQRVAAAVACLRQHCRGHRTGAERRRRATPPGDGGAAPGARRARAPRERCGRRSSSRRIGRCSRISSCAPSSRTSSGAARRSSACWSAASATTPSSCSIPEGRIASWNAGAEQHQGLQGRGNHRPAFLALLPAGGDGRASSRRWSWKSPRASAGSRTKAGACARTARRSGPT